MPARIRSIKPDFFTSADMLRLSPLARLFYIGVWCEADREGRLVWQPDTLKIRYLPIDDCDPDEVAEELVRGGHVLPYEAGGRMYALLPTFRTHQVINHRESPSRIPAPPADLKPPEPPARLVQRRVTRAPGSMARAAIHAPAEVAAHVAQALGLGQQNPQDQALTEANSGATHLPGYAQDAARGEGKGREGKVLPTADAVGDAFASPATPRYTSPKTEAQAKAAGIAGLRELEGLDLGVGLADPEKSALGLLEDAAQALRVKTGPAVPECPHQKVLTAWAEVLPELPRHTEWTQTRAAHLRSRWREAAVRYGWKSSEEGIAYLRQLFEWIRESDFLMGKARSRDPGRKPFVIELEWLLQPNNWARVVEGKYHDGGRE